MKINPINFSYNHNNTKPNFKGVWGERKFIKNTESENLVSDYYELRYHPFLEETNEEIDKIVSDKTKEISKTEAEKFFEENVSYYEHTTVKKAKKLKLTSLECEQIAEKLDKEMPKSLNEYSKLIKAAKKYLKNLNI